ncbi:MAG TPA: hypothetical protein VNQ90_14720 [Chthoniobacteraceae bacterium]|nr:hypothetical protein [Chthoniobacteraceae bacterium]
MAVQPRKRAPGATAGRSPRRRNRSGGNRRKPSSRPLSLRDLLTRRNAVRLWWLGLLWWLGVALFPPSYPATRFSGVVFAGLLALGLLALWWRYRVLRWSWLGLLALAAFFCSLPGNDWYDRVALRGEIGRALQRYEGTRLFPKGENRLGMDAAGMIRRGTVEGTLLYSFKTLNPLLTRKAFTLWWHDDDLAGLARGARRKARRLTRAKNLSGFDHTLLYPGDMAILADGSLALAYLGEGRWIAPDRTARRLAVAGGPTNAAAEFNTPLSLMRWRFLEMRRTRPGQP